MKHEDFQNPVKSSRAEEKPASESDSELPKNEAGGTADSIVPADERKLTEKTADLAAAKDSASFFTDVKLSGENQPPEIKTGTEFGNYRVIRKIGGGGMGDVYLAQDTILNRCVALKILPEKLTNSPQYLSRFKQEARAASALNHPHILTIYEFGESNQGVQFIATEYVEGQTLNKFFASEEPDLPHRLDILIQIASALAAAHASGIIHRDIKPENVIVRPDGYVKVLDFGLAKVLEKSAPKVSGSEIATFPLVDTNPGMIMGTASYMSPEQAKGKTVDARSDIFSFGVLLYETVSSHLPFTGNSAMEIIAAILHTEPEPLDDETAAPEIKRIIEKALKKDRSERFQTMKDLLIDLKEARRELDFRHKIEQKSHSDADFSKKSGSTDAGSKKIDDAAAETIVINPAPETLRIERVARFSNFQIFLALAVIAALGAFAVWRFSGAGKIPAGSEKSAASSAAAYKSFEITNWANAAGELSAASSFSPDGKFIAYGSTQTGTTSIFVRQSSSNGDAVQVTKDDFYNRYPVWSPAGDEIVYYSKRGDSYGLWRVSSMGGEKKPVAENVEVESKPRFWSKSGKIYFQGIRNLFAVDTQSGEVRQLTDFPAESAPVKIIKISPDESEIAILTIEDNNWKIKIRPLAAGKDDGKLAEIVSSKTPIDNLVWMTDEKSILYSQKTEDFYQIFSADISGGGEPVRLTSGSSDSFIQDVSADGARILYSTVTETSDLWRVDTETAKESLTAAQIEAELWADVSIDGTIAYQSIKNLRQGSNLLNGSIMLQQGVSKDARPLRIAEDGFLPQWSPDGKTVAFLKLANLKMEIWRVSSTGEQLKRLSGAGIDGLIYSLSPYLQSQVKHLSWSPDSSALAFPFEADGISNIRIVSADGGGSSSEQQKLTRNEDGNLRLFCPVWASDGRRIAFAAQTKKKNAEGKIKNSLWFCDKETGIQQKLFETDEAIRLLGWNKKQDALVFAVKKNEQSFTLTPAEIQIETVAVNGGDVRNLTVLKDAYFYNIYLSPDRASIAYTSRTGGQDDIWISPLETSAAQPRKLTANNDSRLYFSSLAWSPDGKSIFFGKQTRFTLLSMLVNQKTKEKQNAETNQ